jgi:hypothetical protein
MGQTVEVPTEILSKFLRATRALEEFRDAMEDFFIANNPAELRKLRRARREDLAGNTRPFEELLRQRRPALAAGSAASPQPTGQRRKLPQT